MTDVHGSAAAAAAWYPDPNDAGQWRWWDGVQWTEHVTPVIEPAPSKDSPLFPHTPTGPAPSVTGTFLSILRDRWILTAVAFVIAAVMVRAGFGSGSRGLMEIGAIGFVALLAIYGAEAKSRVWTTLFTARGLEPIDEWAEWEQAQREVPILQTGSSRACEHAARGVIGGFPATCGELSITTGSGKSASTRHFLFAAFEIPAAAAARHPGVSVRERGLRARTKGPKDGGERVELESIRVSERLEIRVCEGSNPVSTRELFSPVLVEALSRLPVSWDQRGRRLLVYQDTPTERAKTFDPFCAIASIVARAYWDDQR